MRLRAQDDGEKQSIVATEGKLIGLAVAYIGEVSDHEIEGPAGRRCPHDLAAEGAAEVVAVGNGVGFIEVRRLEEEHDRVGPRPQVRRGHSKGRACFGEEDEPVLVIGGAEIERMRGAIRGQGYSLSRTVVGLEGVDAGAAARSGCDRTRRGRCGG